VLAESPSNYISRHHLSCSSYNINSPLGSPKSVVANIAVGVLIDFHFYHVFLEVPGLPMNEPRRLMDILRVPGGIRVTHCPQIIRTMVPQIYVPLELPVCLLRRLLHRLLARCVEGFEPPRIVNFYSYLSHFFPPIPL